MNIYKLLPILGFLLLIVVIDCGDGTYLRRRYRHYAYGAALLPATVLLTPYMVGASPGIVFLLLLKILALKRRIIIVRLMAIGALIVARGTSLLIGASLGNIGTLYLLHRLHGHHGWHAHYPSWHKSKHNGRLRSLFRRFPRFKLRWPITRVKPLRQGWGRPPPYYRWPAAAPSYTPTGWGYNGYTTHSSPSVVTKDSGWVQSNQPSGSGWGSNVQNTYAGSSAEGYSGSSYSSSPISSNSEEYSAPVGQDSGWISGNPSYDWKSSSKKRRGAKTDSASIDAKSAENSKETDFMTGMASTYKEIFGDWFSDITKLLMKNEMNVNDENQNSTSTDRDPNIIKILNKRRIKDILEPYVESEAFLEQQFTKIEEDDEDSKEDKSKLYFHLREAYMQSLLDELAIDSKDTIPEFVPMPADPEVFNATATDPESTSKPPKASTSKSESFSVSQSSSVKSESSSRRKRSTAEETEKTKENSNDLAQAEKEVEYVENLIGETRELFTLLSAFDQDTCMQKLVCDVHTRVEEAKEEGSYDYNMISMFKLVNTLLVGDYKGSSMKYREAAYYGEVNRSEELCQKRYKSCEHTSKEIIQMGQELE